MGSLWLQHCFPAGYGRCGVVIQFLVPVAFKPVVGLLVGNHIVDASSLVFFLPVLGVNVF